MKVLFGFFAASALAAGSALADIVDPRLYKPAPGDEVIDSGVMNVYRLGQDISSEEFRVIRRADGGRTIVSVVTAADNSFEIPARWDYDADEQAIGAAGRGKHAGPAFEVTLARDGDAATMSVVYESGERVTHEGKCPKGCLMDMMHRPIKFRVGRTVGLRAGFEDIDDRLVPQ